MNFQPFPRQPDERRRRFRPLFLGNLLDDGLNRSLYQHAQYRIGIRTDRACHADRLGQDMHRVGSARGNALNPADECFDSGKRSVWHSDSIAHRMAVRQEYRASYCQSVTTSKIPDNLEVGVIIEIAMFGRTKNFRGNLAPGRYIG